MSELTHVFENAAFLVVDKPAGWLTVPARTGEADPRPCLTIHLAKTAKLLTIHRLDAEVSGLVAFAKTAEAHRAANHWFEARHVHKTYEALSERPVTMEFPKETAMTWKSKLLRGKKRAYEKPFGKDCHTEAWFLGNVERDGKARGHFKLHPRTGRPHQLRFEMAKHGFPIWGDTLYGATQVFVDTAIALRSVELNFAHCAGRETFGLPESVATSPL